MVLVVSGCRGHRSPSSGSGGPAGRRVVLVGVDAADWRALDPLIAAGRLPTFARLQRKGHTAILVATPPLVSPLLWTTIATGRSPMDHGVLDFMVDLPSGGQAPVSSLQRKVPALWDFFSAAGRNVAVVGWWATWPAEPIRGTMVSDRVAPQMIRPQATLDERAIWPPEAAPRLRAYVVRPEQVPIADLRAYVPVTPEEHHRAQEALGRSGSQLYGDRIAHLAAVVGSLRSYGALAEALIREGPPELLAVYLETVDTVSHLFVRDASGPAAIEQAYREADALVARLARASAPGTLVIVCSDHGFQPADAAVGEDPADLTGPATAWHRPYGMLAVAEAGALVDPTDPVADGAPSAPATTATPLDIAPTVLHAAGLAVGTEMPGRVLTSLLPADRAGASVQRNPSPPRPEVAPVRDSVDADALARLRALGYVGGASSSLAGQNLGEVLYRAGRLPEAERVLRGVVESQPHNLAAHLWLAKALSDQGRPRDALRVYAQAVRLPGGPASALVAAVELAATSSLAAEGRALLLALPPREQAAAPAAVARAILASSAGRVREAEAALRAAIGVEPTSFDALSRLLDLLIPQGRAKEALPALSRAASLARGSPRHLALLGEALLANKAAADAEKPLAAALALAPDSAALRMDLARAQLAQDRPEAACATLDPAPASPERSVLLGASRSRQGRWQEAASHFQEALARASPTPDRLNGLAWAQHKLGRDREAAELLRLSLQMDGSQPQVRTLLAQLESRVVAR